MAYDLGSAEGSIVINYDGTAAQRAQDDITGLGDAGTDSSAKLNKAAGVAGKIGLVIAAGFGVAVKSAADFEQRMSAVEAVSGATAGEMETLRQKALDIGKDTAFSASEGASAIEELVKAGVSVPDVMNGAADATVALAAAGEIALPEAAAIASNAMNQFQLAAKDLPSVADNIAGAANASAIDVAEFGQSLSQVGAVANLAGVSFADTSTAIALLGNSGIKGSDAGTSLKTMFQRLQPETDKAKQAFRELGLLTEDGSNKFYTAGGELKSMSDVSQILQNSLRGLTSQQKQAALQTLFGSDAIRGAAILAREGSKGFDQMANSMGKVSAADVAAKRMDNLKGKFEEFKGSLETLGIIVGTVLLPALTKITEVMTSFLEFFLELPSGVQTAIVIFVGLVGAFALVLAVVLKMVVFFRTLQIVLAGTRLAFITTWLAALGPIALVIVAVLAIVAVIVLLWKKSETFRNIVMAVWDAIKTAAMAVGAWFAGPFADFFVKAYEKVKSGLSAVKTFFVVAWNAIKSVVTTVVTAITAFVMGGINILKSIIQVGLSIIGAVWNAFWGMFGGLIKAVWGLIVAIIRLGWTIVKGLFLLNLQLILGFARTIWNAITTVIRVAWNIIKTVVRAGANFVKGIVTTIWNAIKAVTSAVWNGIMAVIRAVWARIGGTVMTAVNRVKAVLSAAWNAVKSNVSAAWNGIVNVVGGAVGKLVAKVAGIKDKVLSALGNAASWLYQKGKDIVQGLIDGITSMINTVRDKISELTDIIADHLPGSPVKEGPLKVLNQGYAGKKIVEMLVDGVGSMAGPMTQVMQTVTAVPALAGDLAGVGMAGAPLSTTGVGPGQTYGGRRPRAATGGGRSRLVEGRFDFDRGYFEGIAQDVIDENDDYRGDDRGGPR